MIHLVASRVLIPIALVLAAASAATAQTITLAWDPVSDPDVVGYRLWYGSTAGSYPNSIDVGSQTTYTVSGIDTAKEHYFAVQSYASSGLTSALSSPVKWTPPVVATAQITSFTVSPKYPLLVSKPVTWTAVGSSLGGVVEYQFWLMSKGAWQMVQDYSSTNTFTWTPGFGDAGTHALQVWARTAGSTAKYEAWVTTGSFEVSAAPVQLTSSVEFPAPPGTMVTWTAAVAGYSGSTLEYQFWVLTQATGSWSILRDWNTSPGADWTPQTSGKYAVQVWVRRVGSTAKYETWAGSQILSIQPSPVKITTFGVDAELPALTGTTLTWTAKASGGTRAPLEYQFWRVSRGNWQIVQPYSTSNTYTWRPTWGDEGTFALQVWVRSAGSTADYEDWKSTGYFEVRRAALQLAGDTLFPAPAGTRTNWLAEVADPTANLEFQFWVYDSNGGRWSIAQPYSAAPQFEWTPAANGKYAIQVWARAIGSAARYDSWRGTDYLDVGPSALKLRALKIDRALPVAAGQTITWMAEAVGGSAPVQYQFWVYQEGTGWTLGRDWSTDKLWAWTPAAAGQYAVQVWAKSTGSPLKYEAWLSSGYFSIQ